MRRKAIRVVHYKGRGRAETLREQIGHRGYASGFEGLISFIMALVPTNEVIEQALRRTVPMFPELAVRELVANALIHQDLFVTGAEPMVEIFDDRMEVTNPGEPLVDTLRFLDTPPKSRNEVLASLMRRFRWRYEDHIFMREPGETDDALRDRVLSLTEKYKNPPNGQLFISIV